MAGDAVRATIIVRAENSAERLRPLESVRRMLQGESLPGRNEVLLVSPSTEVARYVSEHDGDGFEMQHVPESNAGRGAALNAALPRVNGKIVVVMSDFAPPKPGAITKLLAAFDDPAIDAACGRPVPESGRDKLHFWQRLLCESAHWTRSAASRRGVPFPLAGELYAFRAHVMKGRVVDLECGYPDTLVSQLVGVRMRYVEDAEITEYCPKHFREWLEEKVRMLAAARHRWVERQVRPVRRLTLEVGGVIRLLRMAGSHREFWWTLQLLFARLMSWVGATVTPLIARDWLTRPFVARYPLTPPEPGDVYEVRSGEFGVAASGWTEVVVCQVRGFEEVLVVPRFAPAPGQSNVIPSRAYGTVFPNEGVFIKLLWRMNVAELGTPRGQCPTDQWRWLREVR